MQAIWQLIHSRFTVSVENVPLLGNHVEPIVLLIAPIFFFVRHPMLFVVVQNAALASMGPVAYDIARRLGATQRSALCLAAAILIMPATGFIALHEFHPEALSAPFLLLMLRARTMQSLRQHWLWLGATLACKENMALLIAGYCAVQCLAERNLGWAHIRRWYLAPFILAASWFLLASKVITPLLNSGNIDYLALYQRFGSTPGEILLNLFRRPQLFIAASWKALLHGNLVSGLLLPLCLFPLLRPKWIAICIPILLQHLLSWRSSEWMIYFHYAAPLVPLLWFATAEGTIALQPWYAPILVLFGCIVGQVELGPAAGMELWPHSSQSVAEKDLFVSQIPADASVVAPLPYLSHLAMRRELYSLHYILKGLKTLSREPFVPPPPADFVLIDYSDSATFDVSAGFYHPTMHTVTDKIIPSSDALLHDYLASANWRSRAIDTLTLLQRKTQPPAMAEATQEGIEDFRGGTRLLGIERIAADNAVELVTTWSFDQIRTVFPWLELHATAAATGRKVVFTRGLCAPEAGEGIYQDRWRCTQLRNLVADTYRLEVHFFDKSTHAELVAPRVLGDLRVAPSGR